MKKMMEKGLILTSISVLTFILTGFYFNRTAQLARRNVRESITQICQVNQKQSYQNAKVIRNSLYGKKRNVNVYLTTWKGIHVEGKVRQRSKLLMGNYSAKRLTSARTNRLFGIVKKMFPQKKKTFPRIEIVE